MSGAILIDVGGKLLPWDGGHDNLYFPRLKLLPRSSYMYEWPYDPINGNGAPLFDVPIVRLAAG